MILIKTKCNGFNAIFNYNNCTCVQINNDCIIIVENTEEHYLFVTDNKELREKVYNEIQNQIIDLNAKNESGCIDVDRIVSILETESEEHEIIKARDSNKKLYEVLVSRGIICTLYNEYIEIKINDVFCVLKREFKRYYIKGNNLNNSINESFDTVIELVDYLKEVQK